MKRILIILAAVIVLTGCGPRLVYPNLDWLIPWYLDNYMSLDSSQKSDLKKTISRQLNWHCGTQLDAYAKFLRELSREMGDPNDLITHAALANRWESLRGFWKELMAQISPDVADLLLSLSDAQIEKLFARLEKRNRKLSATYVDVDPQKIVGKRKQYMLKHMKRWISRLTPEQKQLVAAWSNRLEPTEADWMAHRLTIQSEYRQLFTRRDDKVHFREKIVDLLVYQERYRSEAYQQKIQFNTELTIALILDIDRQLSEKQRQRLQKKLSSLARDFEHLSCDLRRNAPPSPVERIIFSPQP
jgi:hypothetical protein